MADVAKKSSKLALLAGLAWFVAFETVAFYGLRYLTSGLGESNQYQAENTIVSNWLKTMVFFVAHLALIITAVLVLSNRLPRRHRGQIMGWFYLPCLGSWGA